MSEPHERNDSRAVTPDRPSIVFMGTADFAVPSLEALVDNGYPIASVVTRASRPAGRGRRELAPPIAQAAQRLGLDLMQPERIRRPEVVDAIRALRPDLIVVAAYGQILPPSVLSIPVNGCLNVHASLLPRHRGASPISASILAGDAETGITIMQMDAGMDTGPIISQSATPIADEDDQRSLTDRLAAMGASLLLEVIPRWIAHEVQAQPQDSSGATTTRPTQREDGALDWSQPAVDLWRRVRAFAEAPQGYTNWEGKLLRIPKADFDSGVDAEPGLVIPWGPQRRVPSAAAIGTGRGVLIPRIVILEGRRPMSIDAFIPGHSSFIGAHLATDSST